MSPSKEFRELQFKSSQLAAVFVGILIVGVIIFILGVSVGKKQGRLAAGAGPSSADKVEPVAPAKLLPREEKSGPAKAEPSAVQTKMPAGKPEATKAAPGPEASKAAPPPAEKAVPAAKPASVKPGSYFVQASATNDRAAATAFAGRLEKEGFPVVVLDPFPTDTKAYFRVRVGPFPSKEDAEAARARLAAVLKKRASDFFLVKV